MGQTVHRRGRQGTRREETMRKHDERRENWTYPIPALYNTPPCLMPQLVLSHEPIERLRSTHEIGPSEMGVERKNPGREGATKWKGVRGW